MSKKQSLKSQISQFISSHRGQTFFNFAYSIGAAIVIWGVLFHILHLPGGNALLAIGLGTEVVMFIITAFDIPPRSYRWENVYPELDGEENGTGDRATLSRQVSDRDTLRLVEAIEKLERVVTATGTTPVSQDGDEECPALSPVNTKLADRVNRATADYCEQAEQLAANMRRLNEIYSNMLSALERTNQQQSR